MPEKEDKEGEKVKLASELTLAKKGENKKPELEGLLLSCLRLIMSVVNVGAIVLVLV